MKFSNLGVASRLGVGFGALLVITLVVSGLSWLRMSQIDAATDRMVEQEWHKARLTMEMQIRSRDNASKAARVFLAGGDAELVEKLRAEMAANTRANETDLGELEQLVTDADDKALLDQAARARDEYTTRRSWPSP